MPQSKPTYNPDWSDGNHFESHAELTLSQLGLDRCKLEEFTPGLNTQFNVQLKS